MKKSVTINFTLSNRAIYTLIAFLTISILGVGVYAVVDTSKGWHDWDQIENIPAGFADGIDSAGHTNGGNCPEGQYARGVDANGAAEDCTVDDTGGPHTIDTIHHDHNVGITGSVKLTGCSNGNDRIQFVNGIVTFAQCTDTDG